MTTLKDLQRRIEALERAFFQGKLQLEDHNFRIDSEGWIAHTSPNGIRHLENPEGDVWEMIDPKYPDLMGEQLFTWDAAMRETTKAGKRMPTDEEFSRLLTVKSDMPNPVLAGRRNTDGSFAALGTRGYFWSSLEGGSSAWRRNLNSSEERVNRYATAKERGFSVRCLKD